MPRPLRRRGLFIVFVLETKIYLGRFICFIGGGVSFCSLLVNVALIPNVRVSMVNMP